MRRLILATKLLLTAVVVVAADDPGFTTHTLGVPAGFEDLGGPQKTLVDVHFGGRFLVSTLAEFSDEFIRFIKPDEIVEAVDNWTDPEGIERLLGTKLPPHTERLCEYPNQSQCGRLTPDRVGVIFDPLRFRAELFIAPKELQRAEASEEQYLPPGDSERTTAVQNLNLLVSGDSSGSSNRYSLFGRTRAGRNDKFAFAELATTSERPLLVDEVGFHYGMPDHAIDVGLFEMDPHQLRATGRDLLLGARVARSLNRRTDLTSILATPLDIFLPSRSRVNIFRDGRLIAAGFYEAGHQLLDTSQLPFGAYLVEIVATDASGQEIREERLFVKSASLAPPGEPLWYFEAGSTAGRATDRAWPDTKQDLQVRGGLRWRQQRWLGLGVATAANRHESLGELSANLILDRLDATAELFGGDRGAYGWVFRTSARWNGGNINLNTQYSQPGRSDDTDRLIAQAVRLNSLLVSQRIAGFQINLSFTESQFADSDSVVRRNLRITRDFRLSGNDRIRVSVDTGVEDNDEQFGVNIQWTGAGKDWTYGAVHERRYTESASAADTTTSSAFGRTQGQFRTGTDWKAGVAVRRDSLGEQISVDAEQFGARGATRLGFTQAIDGSASGSQYSLGHESSLVLGPERGLTWGSPYPDEAAALVDLESAGEGQVDVLVDGRRLLSARSGTQFPVTLSPYREYQIGLRDRGAGLLDFDGNDKTVLVYPGDVKKISWRVDRVLILVARVYRWRRVCMSGRTLCLMTLEPLRGVTFDGVSGWAESSDEGFLQAEIREDATELRARLEDGRPCRIDLRGLSSRSGIIRADRLICRTASQRTAPATPSPP